MSNKQTVGELVYKLSGDGKELQAELKKTEQEVVKLESSMKKADKSTSTFGESLKKLAGVLGFTYLAQKALEFGKASIQAFANAQQSLIQFNNAQENVAGSTREQINSLNDYVNELERKTTVDDKSIRQAAQILAQDQIKIDNQKKLLGGIVDISVANAKANGSQIDTQGTAVAIGRAIATGELGALTRQNIVGIDATRVSLFKLGDQATRTRILVELMAENGAGAGERLANSLQGSMNRAGDAIEDIQVYVGKVLNVAFKTLVDGIIDTSESTDGLTKKSHVFGTIMVGVAGAIGSVIVQAEQLAKAMYHLFIVIGDAGLVAYNFALDVIKNFKGINDTIKTTATAMTKVLSGDFKGALEDVKGSLGDLLKPSEYTSEAIQKMKNDFDKMGVSMLESEKKLEKNTNAFLNSGKVYEENAAQIDALTEAQDAYKKEAEKAAQATEEEKKAMQALRDKVFELRQKTDELSVSLGDKLVEAVNKFKESSKDIVTEGAKSLVDIVVTAEKDIADLRKQLAEEQSKSQDKQSADSIKKLQDEIAQKQKILTSQADFQNILTKQIADTQKQVDDATLAGTTETDPAKKARFDAVAQGNQLQLEALKGFADLDKQIADARKLAGEDEFRQAQINIFSKLELAKLAFIEETTKLREKQAIAIDVENQITSFYKTQTAIRQKTLDTFATNAIAQLRRVGEEARSAMAALDQARSRGIQIDSPIIPVSTPTTSGGISTSTSTSTNTSNTKNINAPITVNATIQDGTDPVIVAKELQWQLSKTN